jgi:hypothetical protein
MLDSTALRHHLCMDCLDCQKLEQEEKQALIEFVAADKAPELVTDFESRSEVVELGAAKKRRDEVGEAPEGSTGAFQRP